MTPPGIVGTPLAGDEISAGGDPVVVPPAGATAGETLLLQMEMRPHDATLRHDDWTLIAEQRADVSSEVLLRVFSIVYAGETDWTFDATPGGYLQAEWVVTRWPAGTTFGPVSSAGAAFGAPIVLPSITMPADSTLVAMISGREEGDQALTSTEGMTLEYQLPGDSDEWNALYTEEPATGATGTRTFTWTYSGDRMAGIMLVAAPADETGPVVTIITPEDGALVWGDVDIQATATDPSTPIDVQAFIRAGDVLHASGPHMAPPYIWTWDSTSVEEGEYTLEVYAEDSLGNNTTESITITVDNPDPAPPTVPTIHVRERPPLRQSIDLCTPSGRHYRWAEDEPNPANIPSGQRHSSTMPGGHESCDVVLPRKPGIDYGDLERLSTLTIHGPSGDIHGEFRLERTPRVAGDQMAISPSAVGWQAALDDNKTVQVIFVDPNIGGWTEPSLARRAQLSGFGADLGKFSGRAVDGGLAWDIPAEAIPDETLAELWYNAPAGVTLGALGYRGERDGTWTGFETPTLTGANDQAGASTTTGLTLDDTVRVATIGARRRLMLRAYLSGGPQTPPAGTQQRYSQVAVYGDHGLTLYDTDDGLPGIVASDAVVYAVGRWATALTFRVGETVLPSRLVLPHLAFPEPTTVAEIVRQATRLELQDWAVWDKRTFWWHPRDTFGRRWRARIGPAHLEETGPQVDRVWESIVVAYQGADGTPLTAGPLGSGADIESALLKDSDPDNPATRAGIVRRDVLTIGVSDASTAIKIGQRFLEQTRLLDTSGRAQIVGHVEDDRGVLHHHAAMRAGDTIEFIDAGDASPRRIVHIDHQRDARASSVDLDAPPEGLQALLEQLGAGLAPLGL